MKIRFENKDNAHTIELSELTNEQLFALNFLLASPPKYHSLDCLAEFAAAYRGQLTNHISILDRAIGEKVRDIRECEANGETPYLSTLREQKKALETQWTATEKLLRLFGG